MKHPKNAVRSSGLTALLLSVSLSASAAGVHQHGVADAAVVLEAQDLTVTFRAPLMDILGTTRPPGDAAARVRYAQRLEQLTPPVPVAEAQCESVSTVRTTLAQLFPDDDSHDHEAHDDHGDDHDHDHDHDDHVEHQDVEAEWHFVCQQPDALNALSLPFLNTFSSLTTEVVLLLPSGQNALQLSPGNTRIPLE